MKDLELALKIKATADGLSNIKSTIAGLKEAGVETAQWEDAARDLESALQQVSTERGLIDQFKKIKQAVADSAETLTEAQQKAQALGKALNETEEPTKAQVREFENARKAVKKAEAAYKDSRLSVQSMRAELKAAGIETKSLSDNQIRTNKSTTELASRVDLLSSGLEQQTLRQKEAATAATAAAETQKKLSKEEIDRQLLGLKAHAEIEQEIEATQQAYERLKKSGKLTQAELAQAALKTEERIRELKHQTNGWSESLQNAKGSMTALAGSVAGLAVMSGYAIDFESAMADVRKVVDGTDDQFEQLTGRIKEMSGELPITAEGLAKIAAAGGQLGVPIDKLDQFVELAAKMSVAFDLSVEQAGDAVAKLSNIFNIPIENVEALGDAINTLGNTTAAREADILDVLTRIGGTASQFKLTADQAAALAATMIEMGAKSEVAGTGINALLSKLQTANVQGPEFKGALEGIGLSAKQLADDIRGNPQQALTEFLRTLSKLDDQSRAETLTRLFGQEYQDDIARLLNGLDKYDASLARVTNTGNTAGAMQREFAARMETTEAQIQLMQNGLQEIAINLGTIFLPIIRASAEGIGDVSRALADFVEANPSIAAIATSLGTVAVTAGALRLVFLSLRIIGVKAFGDIGKEVSLSKLSIKELTAQVGLLGGAIRTIGGLWSAWEIGRDIGDQLAENFVWARKLGVELAAAFSQLAAAATLAWDVISNPSDASDAWARFNSELDNIQVVYGQIYAEVEAGIDVQKKAADAAVNTGSALKDAGDKGAEAAQKIRDEFAKINLASTSGVHDFIKLIDDASDKTGILTDSLKKWISEANAADLSKFAYGVQSAYAQQKISAEQLAEYNNEILQKSFNDLGLSAEAALGKVGPAAQEAITQLDNIAVTLNSMGVTGQQRMAALEVAIRAALGQADSAAALQEISERIAQMGSNSEISAAQIARLTRILDTQANALNQIKPGIQSVEDGMRQLGLTSQEELKKAAASARMVVEQLQAMGAPVADQKSAFMNYAQAAIAANEGIISTELRLQAIRLGLTDELQQLVGDQEQLGDAGEQAGDKTEKGAKKAAEATRDVGAAAKDSERDVQAVGASLAAWFQSVRDEVAALSEQARAAFDSKLGINTAGPVSELDALKQSIAAAREELGKVSIDNLQVFDPTGVNRFKNSVIEAKNETLIAFQEQKIKALDYINALESGKGVNQAFINQAKNAQQWMNLLGEEDLSQLQSALDSANQKLESMRAAAKSVVDGLQDELDQLNGNQEAIAERQYKN
ncbi:MAG: phage tail tape measure protein, partial [Thalassolituus sp. CG17_big_fil_post_rev_8_21_14_2_50_53_8]